MENTYKIKIEHFIIHILDNKTETLTLSDFECPITEEIKDFLIDYINYTLNSERNRIARFIRPNNFIEDASNEILSNPGKFIDQSQIIATYLFGIMTSDKRISKGDLLICIYSIRDEHYSKVAIFKVDLMKAFFHNIEKSGTKTSITIDLKPNAFPPPADLQKCVSIQPFKPEEFRKEFDLIILDNQISSVTEEPSVRNFFCKLFLNCNLVLNDRDRTKHFMKFTEKWIRENLKNKDISDSLADKMRDLSSATLQAQIISVPDFAAALLPTKELQDDYIQFTKENGLPDMVFTPDPLVAGKLTKKRRFEGDFGLYIEVDSDKFDDVISIESDREDAYKIIIIKTIKWNEVPHK